MITIREYETKATQGKPHCWDWEVRKPAYAYSSSGSRLAEKSTAIQHAAASLIQDAHMYGELEPDEGFWFNDGSYHEYSEAVRQRILGYDGEQLRLRLGAPARSEPFNTGSLKFSLNPSIHAELKSIAEAKEMSLEDLLAEGINLVLQHHGKKPIA